MIFRLDAGEPVTALAGVHAGCYELFAHEPIRTISDLKGKRVGVRGAGSGGHLLAGDHGGPRGARPPKDIEWVTSSAPAHGAVRRRKGRCLPRLSSRAAGAARPQDRPGDPQHRHGQALVAVFLLHRGGQQGLRPRLIRSPPSAPACHPQGRRHLRRRAGNGPRNGWSMAGSRSGTTTRSRR